MGLKPRNQPPTHTAQRRPAAQWVQPRPSWVAMGLIIGSDGVDLSATFEGFNPVSGDPVDFDNSFAGFRPVTTPIVLIESGVAVTDALEISAATGSSLTIIFPGIAFLPGTPYRLACGAQQSGIRDGDGLEMAPFVLAVTSGA